MGFIEKVVGLMNHSEPENSSAEKTEEESSGKSQEQSPVSDETPPEKAETQTYTQEELEKLLQEKKEEWMQEQAEAERERIRNLPEQERLKQEQLSKDAEISRLKEEILRRDLKAEIIKTLDEKKLPVSIAELVQYGDRESTMKSLEKITEVFERSVQEGVMLRLRGKTPDGLGRASKTENRLSDPFTKALSESVRS